MRLVYNPLSSNFHGGTFENTKSRRESLFLFSKGVHQGTVLRRLSQTGTLSLLDWDGMDRQSRDGQGKERSIGGEGSKGWKRKLR